ncbi:hypothetical protein [Streptomyces scopuliridis]|nr:hypothetical protein [Streptomyces scopuliridis]
MTSPRAGPAASGGVTVGRVLAGPTHTPGVGEFVRGLIDSIVP